MTQKLVKIQITQVFERDEDLDSENLINYTLINEEQVNFVN